MLHPTRSPANWPLLSVGSHIDAEARSLKTVKWTALLSAISLRLTPKQDSGRIPDSNIGAALELAGFQIGNIKDLSTIPHGLRVAEQIGLKSSEIEAILTDGTTTNNADYETVSRTLRMAFRVYVDRIEQEARRCDGGLAVWRSPARFVHLGISDRIARWSTGAPDPRLLDWDGRRVMVAFSALERTASELLACLVLFAALTNLRLRKKESAAVAVSVGAGNARMPAGTESASVSRSSSGPNFGASDSAALLRKMFALAAVSMAKVDKTVDRIRLPLFVRTPGEAE